MIFDLFSSNIPSKRFSKLSQSNIELILPGKHNISNSVAAAGVCYYLGVSSEDISEGITTFSGINRRFEVLINNKDLAFVDDYAHHPEEVRSTINAAKQLFPNRTITVVFQPHLYSRTQDFVNEFAVSLSLADKLILLDIYPAREKPISGVNSQMLLDLCTNPKKETCSKQELVETLKKELFRKKQGIIPENTNFGVKSSTARSFLEANSVSLPDPGNKKLSKKKLRNLIIGGTHFLSCWNKRDQTVKRARKSRMIVSPSMYRQIEALQ